MDSDIFDNNLGAELESVFSDEFDMILPPSDIFLSQNPSIDNAYIKTPSNGSKQGRQSDFDSAQSKTGSKRQRSGISTKGSTSDVEKRAKRRLQVAVASRASRARRKIELQTLRKENANLRNQSIEFMNKIDQLQSQVERLREEGSSNVKLENTLLRWQLEEHKRFISNFKDLCHDFPAKNGAQNAVFRQGSETAQNYIVTLVIKSVVERWKVGVVTPEANIPYQDFAFYYRLQHEFGEDPNVYGNSIPRRRLNVRVDLTFPGSQSSTISDFMWDFYSNRSMQERVYRKASLDLVDIVNDTIDSDTKVAYFREKRRAPETNQDWAVICGRQWKAMSKFSLSSPQQSQVKIEEFNLNKQSVVESKILSPLERPFERNGRNFLFGSSNCIHHNQNHNGTVIDTMTPASILALSSTRVRAHRVNEADRITSMFVQGVISWDQGGSARTTLIFSFPDKFSFQGLSDFNDIVTPDGTMGVKFADFLKEFNEMLGERKEDDFVF